MTKKGISAREDPQSPVDTRNRDYLLNAGFETRQEEVLAVLKQKRISEAKAKIALEKAILVHARAEEDMARLYQMKVYEIKTAESWEEAMEAGGGTEEWESVVIQHLLSSDADWAEALGEIYKLQEAAKDARATALALQADVANLHEETGMLRNRGIMRAALLFASAPARIDISEPYDARQTLESG